MRKKFPTRKPATIKSSVSPTRLENETTEKETTKSRAVDSANFHFILKLEIVSKIV